jgi:hypothetical protein
MDEGTVRVKWERIEDDEQPFEEERGGNIKQEQSEVAQLQWRGEVLLANGEAIQIKWSTLQRQFLEVLGPLIHTHLRRDRQKLPIRFAIPLWGVIATALQHRHQGGWNLTTAEEVRHFLGEWTTKTFSRGSYAVVEPPLTIDMVIGKNVANISFHCTVYNGHGTKQWPIFFNLK